MENKQTAVGWLIDKIVQDQMYKALSQREWIEIFEQAKQMEMQQIIDANLLGLVQPLHTDAMKQAQEYYAKNYGTKKE